MTVRHYTEYDTAHEVGAIIEAKIVGVVEDMETGLGTRQGYCIVDLEPRKLLGDKYRMENGSKQAIPKQFQELGRVVKIVWSHWEPNLYGPIFHDDGVER